jgi:NitT/TauT family transport system permease protein
MTNSTIKNSKVKKALITIIVTAFWILVWQMLYLVISKEILIVSPLSTFNRIIELSGTSKFWISVLNSMSRIMWGYLLGIVIGFVLALGAIKFKVIDILFGPIVSLIKTTPVASFILLALVWIATSNVAVFIVVLMVMPMSFFQTKLAIQSVDKKLIEMTKVFSLGWIDKLNLLYVPSVKPFFMSVFTVSLGFAWKAGIAAEVVSIPKNSIGHALYNSKIYLETGDLFAWTIVVIALSVVIEKLLIFSVRKVGCSNDN